MKTTATRKNRGFTLMELMITVAIIGILASITIPSYTKYVQKSKRSDAKVELLRIAQLQESYFVQNMSYAKDLTTAAGGLGLGATVLSEQEQYTITMTALDAANTACDGTSNDPCTSFTVQALARASTSQANDTACIGFSITNTGLKGAATGTIGTHNAATADQTKTCWK